MLQNVINPDQSIRELLNRFPQAVPVFLRHSMTCVGCSMSGFDTLRDAAQVYGLQLDRLIAEIQVSIRLSVSR